MSIPLLTSALILDSLKLTVPRAPRSKEPLIRSVISNLECATEDLGHHQERLSSCNILGNGGLFLADAINEVNEANEDM